MLLRHYIVCSLLACVSGAPHESHYPVCVQDGECKEDALEIESAASMLLQTSLSKLHNRPHEGERLFQTLARRADEEGQVRLAHGTQIPDQLVMTGGPATPGEMPGPVRQNIVSMILLQNQARKKQGLLPIRLRWLSTDTCHSYIKKHYDKDLVHLFQHAEPSFYKGDICRTAVLLREGGFYMDVDMQLSEPFLNLVDKDTTFMSARSKIGGLLNGLMAAAPGSPVLQNTLNFMRKWYTSGAHRDRHSGLMGTNCTLRGLEKVIQDNCPDLSLKATGGILQWSCGDHVIRLYEEKELRCSGSLSPSPECPIERKQARSFLARIGIFRPEQPQRNSRELIGWTRLI